MNDSSGYRQGHPRQAYQPQGNGQPPQAAEADAPDFMLEASRQLRLAVSGIEARVRVLLETEPGASPEWDAGVREARLGVADRFIALAEIQYAIPGDDAYGYDGQQ